MDAVDLLIHPTRIRIVYALAGARALTSAELHARIPQVPKATLYRHIATLAQHGVLEVVGERRVRGAVERTYRLRGERGVITVEESARMTGEDHRRSFSAAVAALLSEFNAYLASPGASPVRDAVGYRHFTLWLSDEEKAQAIAELQRLVLGLAQRPPVPDRRPHLLSAIFFPLATAEDGPP
ncbi:MAG TPA: helix-turn-helix domain-containing protein [Gemmatimonadaceae bacterium]|nr:helix-turn-helix domain-containing protein [Gemmatimonadaceae bacterium]